MLLVAKQNSSETKVTTSFECTTEHVMGTYD